MGNFKTVRGMRDFMPEKAKKKQFVEDVCREVFESYGYEPLQTPIVEDFNLLAAKGSGGEAIKDEIYYFRDKAERELGLRYDLTVPLARIVASNPALGKPFKRYQIDTVYRYDRPQAKRYREFTQADIDIVGSKSILSDFECLQVASEIMRKLGLEFTIRINNRVLLEELVKACNVEQKDVVECFRVLDKLDKIGESGVKAEMKEKGIDTQILGQVSTNSLEVAKEKIGSSEVAEEFEKLLSLCRENGLKEVGFDVSLARGLEYYTGNVFEISLNEGPSVGAGGRYDKLVELYGGQSTPCVGISFGVDRLFDNLEGDLIVGPNADVLVVPLSEEIFSFASKIAGKIRNARIGVEVDVMGRNMRKNFDYAQKRGIAFVVAIGENEMDSGKFMAKEVSSGKEIEFSFDDVSPLVRKIKSD